MDDDNDVPQNDNNDPQNPMGEEEIAFRRNQVLMFGVVLLGVLAICLAVSMPSDLEFNDSAIPSSPMSTNEDDSNIPNMMAKNLTNSTLKSFFKNPEDSVENKILRNIAIQKAIKGVKNDYSTVSNGNKYHISKQSEEDNKETGPDTRPAVTSSGDGVIIEKDESDKAKIDTIVQTFMSSEDFEDFIIDVEINDAIKKMRKEKGYKKRENTIFDDLFKQIEKQFLGDDPEEVGLIRRVGEEMEKRAREIIIERKKNRGEDATYEEELIASELYLDYESNYEDSISGSGSHHNSEEVTVLEKEEKEKHS